MQRSFRLCNWSSLWRLVSWINHLPPVCWSTFWKSIFKQQLGCSFDIMDSISSFFCILIYAIICLDTSYIFSASSLLLKYSYFFKYSCTNILHRRNPCTFYLSRLFFVKDGPTGLLHNCWGLDGVDEEFVWNECWPQNHPQLILVPWLQYL